MTSKFVGKKALSHQRIIEAAAKGVRRSGFQGVGVAEVMKEAGLTAGGFYSHFESKEALLAEAMLHASTEIGALIRGNVEALSRRGLSRFRAFVETYLSDSQIADCENGCPVAALCAELPGQVGALKSSSRKIIDNLHKLVREALPPHAATGTEWAVAGALVGAMQIARALGDNKEGRAVLAAARSDLIAHYDQQH